MAGIVADTRSPFRRFFPPDVEFLQFRGIRHAEEDHVMLLLNDAVDLRQWVLRTDVAGRPVGWIDYRDAVRLYHAGQVAYPCGRPMFRIRGGVCAHTGQRSQVEINTIVGHPGRVGGTEKAPEQLHPAAQQPHPVPARRAPVHVLRRPFSEPRPHPRSHPANQPGRPRHLGQRGCGVQALQQLQGRAAARRRGHGVAGCTLRAHPTRNTSISRAGGC